MRVQAPGFITLLVLAGSALMLGSCPGREASPLAVAGVEGAVQGSPVSSAAVEPLPEGNGGLAAKYPDDKGLAHDPAVIHFDDFEDYRTIEDVNRKYEYVMHTENMRLAREPGEMNSGRQAVCFTLPKQEEGNAAALYRVITEERETLFLRYYAKFEKGYDQHGSAHNSGVISAHYFPNRVASPGQRADGRNKFWVSFETERGRSDIPSPGPLNFYVYHPEQRTGYGDHLYPTGRLRPGPDRPLPFGPGFISRPDFIPELDRWYCYEFMVKANTPGRRDGRIAGWVDGKLIADFPGFRLRDVDSLKIDLFGVALFMRPNSIRANSRGFDDIVAAASYIGPIVK